MIGRKLPLESVTSSMAQRRNPRTTQDLYEQHWRKEHLDPFNPHDSRAVQRLNERFQSLNRARLVSLGLALSGSLDIMLPRECKRRAKGMLWWFDRHWAEIGPVIESGVVVTGRDGEPI
jgi:hypothetical protein